VRRGATRPEGALARRLVRRVLSTLALSDGEKLAVRSSSISEDQEDGSGAGQYRSLMHIKQSRLAAALRDFMASNQARRGTHAYRGSVIVQRMVQADCAGVCLTNDRRTGNRDAVIIEMAAGGNAGVTGGIVRPDRLVVDRLTGDILEEERRCPVLRGRAVDVTGMVRQFLTLESRFGMPLDIEWALAGRELYILQARPIVNGHRVASGVGASTSSKLYLLDKHPETAATAAQSADGWRAWLAINASTGALLAAILLVGMGTELWSPLMPEYLSGLAAPILLIALYGSVKDLLDAINFYLGGVLAAHFNTR